MTSGWLGLSPRARADNEKLATSLPRVYAWKEGTSCVNAGLRFGWPTRVSASSQRGLIDAALLAALCPAARVLSRWSLQNPRSRCWQCLPTR